ncbi:MAG: BamA/TamA family outer membrane protein [Acidobacteria bacterium]|nr:BamA/TamA family outer membrane protein [Acidobacteriota bacterium]
MTAWARTPTSVRRLVLILLLAVAAPAVAQDNLVRVKSLTITGVEAFPASRLKAVLQTKASGRFFWGRTRYFDRRSFETDLRRIEAYYIDHGYPDARVDSFDATLDDDQRGIDLSIAVHEGDPITISDILLEGLAGLTEREVRDLQANLPIRPGQIKDRTLVESARGMVARALQNHGYPSSRVAVEERGGKSDREVTVALVGLVGEAAVFGPVSIEGNVGVGQNVIRRALAVKPGERFNLASVQHSQRRLYDLGLFSLVNITTAEEGARGGEVPMRVTVAEANHRQVEFRAGYGTEEKLRAEATMRHLNFMGGARTASAQGKWSSLDRGIRTELRQPYLVRPDLSLTLSAQTWFADEPAYTLHTRGGRATVTHELSQPDVVSGRGAVSSVAFGWLYEREAYSISPEGVADPTFRSQLIALGLDPTTGKGNGILNALTLDYRRSTAPNVLDSTRGYVVQTHAERGGGWLPGDFNYMELSLEGRHYVTLGRLGVLAHRARIASIDGRGATPDQSVPFFKRYFLGGSNSLRGWGRFEVAPLSDGGLPIGGHSLVELSSEIRVPVTERFGAVAFVDAGSVQPDAWNFSVSALRYDAGPGLRYASPIGPLRVDLAFQLNPIPGLQVDGVPEPRRWRIHFSIGQTF